MFVKDRMNPDPVCGSPEMAVTEAQELMLSKGIRHLPIVDDGNALVGLVTRSSLRSALPADVSSFSRFEVSYTLSRIKVHSIMVKEVITIEPDIPIEDAAFLMAEKRIGTLPVVKDGCLVGIISGEDLFTAMASLLGTRNPDKSGVIAALTTAIAKEGGYLSVCVGYHPKDDLNQWISVCKVENMEEDRLAEVICSLENTTILDIRQFQEH